jgi:hypothetical protein
MQEEIITSKEPMESVIKNIEKRITSEVEKKI